MVVGVVGEGDGAGEGDGEVKRSTRASSKDEPGSDDAGGGGSITRIVGQSPLGASGSPAVREFRGCFGGVKR